MEDVQIWDARDMSEAQRRLVAGLICQVWPKPGRTVETQIEKMIAAAESYRGPDQTAPRSFAVFDGDRLAAHAAILCRTIRTERGEITVAGLAQVCTDPQERGRGLGEQVVRAALTPVDQGAFPLAVFQTTPKVQAFYERFGARRIDNRFVNTLAEDPMANPWWNEVIMVYPGDARWPEGTIDLRGAGF